MVESGDSGLWVSTEVDVIISIVNTILNLLLILFIDDVMNCLLRLLDRECNSYPNIDVDFEMQDRDRDNQIAGDPVKMQIKLEKEVYK